MVEELTNLLPQSIQARTAGNSSISHALYFPDEDIEIYVPLPIIIIVWMNAILSEGTQSHRKDATEGNPLLSLCKIILLSLFLKKQSGIV
jgi:hypothetical protein